MPQDLETDRQTMDPILIVDDNHLTLILLETTLTRSGYPVVKAENGREAIDIIESRPISMVICDYQMPATTGVDVLLRAIEKQPDAARILITGNKELSIALEAINIGQVSNILTKPWEDIELLQIVKNSLEKYNLIKENQKLQKLIFAQHQELLYNHDNLIKEHELGIRIHEALLIGKIPKQTPGFSIAAASSSSKELGADFFDFYQPAPHIFDFLIGDAMGTGISSALVGTAIKAQLTRFVLKPSSYQVNDKQKNWTEDILSIEEIMSNLQEELAHKLLHLEYFASLFFVRFNCLKKDISYIDCGAAKPIHYHALSKTTSLLSGRNLPLGTIDTDNYESIKASYRVGDIFLFYSNQFFFNSKTEEEYSLFLSKLLIEHAESNEQELIEIIKKNIQIFSGQSLPENEPTFIVIRITAEHPERNLSNTLGKFSADLSQLKALRSFIERLCHKAPGLADPLASQLQLAINEIFCNIIDHGQNGQEKLSEIVIEATYSEEGMTFDIADQGFSFDPSKVEEPSLTGEKTRGFGLYIIREIADEIVYIPKRGKEGWNHLRLFKKYIFGEGLMEFDADKKNNILILTPKIAALDAKDSSEFKEKIYELINQHQCYNVVFDLSKVFFIDSSGLGSFLSILRTLHTKGGEMKLACLNKPIRTMFELVSMHKILEIYNSTDDAARSFQH